MFVRPHVLMCLVLYKIVDPSPDIRSEALHVLDVMSERLWHVPPSDGKPPRPVKAIPGGSSASPASPMPKGPADRVAVVIGNVQDAYQQFQYQLSTKLAKYVLHDILYPQPPPPPPPPPPSPPSLEMSGTLDSSSSIRYPPSMCFAGAPFPPLRG